MAFNNFFKGAVEIGKAMGVTLKYLAQKPVTLEYPREAVPLYPRFRGKHELRRYENGMERCIGCMLCEAVCPTSTIYVEAAENDPDHPTSPGERYASIYEINLLRCVFCGDCEEACPTEAIVLGHDFAMAGYNRRTFILTKPMLLNPGEPNAVIRPVKLMDFSMIFFILVGALSLAAAVGVVTSKIAVHSALFLLVHFATLAVLYITLDAQFLGAAQVIVYAGGIVILILFVIMLIGSQQFDTRAGYRNWVPYAGIALGVVLVAGLALAFLQTPLTPAVLPANSGGGPETVGMYLYTQGILLVELAAVLLLVALLGALLLARRPQEEKPKIELENSNVLSESDQLARPII